MGSYKPAFNMAGAAVLAGACIPFPFSAGKREARHVILGPLWARLQNWQTYLIGGNLLSTRLAKKHRLVILT